MMCIILEMAHNLLKFLGDQKWMDIGADSTCLIISAHLVLYKDISGMRPLDTRYYFACRSMA